MQPENEDILKLNIGDKKTEETLNKLANVQKSQTSKWEYGFINGEWSFIPPLEYFQCILQRKVGDSVVEMTTYLPGKFAVRGKTTSP